MFFLRLAVRLSFLLLFWNHETVDIFLYDIKKRLPTLTSEANLHDALYSTCATVPFHLQELFPGASSA